jgi:hypothetical protein
VEAAGYLSDRNLHSYEEFDLAVRLRALGWQLWRLPVDAVDHFGHDAPPYSLLMRRWRSRYICGLGELVRAGAGQPRLGLIVQGLRELRLYAAVLFWWMLLVSVVFWPTTALTRLASFAVLLIAPVAVMAWRKKSAVKAVYAVVSWCFNAAGLLRGLLTPRKPALQTISSRVLQEPAAWSPRPARGAGE